MRAAPPAVTRPQEVPELRPRAVVTGAGVRVGRAIALELARSGFDLAVHANRSRADADATAAECRSHGADAFVVLGDLATAEGCASVVAAVTSRWDALHALVNSAAAFEPKPFAAITLEDWEAMHAVDLRAPFLLSQGFLPALQAASSADLGGPATQGGVVVHLCDIGADRPVSGYAHYSTAKAGLVMLVKAMAVELAPRVRTVGVSPGQVAWPEAYDVETRAKLEKRIPLARVGSGDDVARLVRFLVAEGHYLNGVIVPVDGGLACRY
jgi:pteridine reductase